MADVPCLDYPWDSERGYPGDRQTKLHKRGVTEVCLIAYLWESHGRCVMPGLPVR